MKNVLQLKRGIKLFAFMAAFVLSLAGVALGQEQAGSIEGTVSDAQGKGSQRYCDRYGVSQGFNRNGTTDAQGFYRFQQVPPGKYKVQFGGASGFGEATRDDVQVNLGGSTAVNVELAAAGQRPG